MVLGAPDLAAKVFETQEAALVRAFGEPEDYLPRKGWLERIQSKQRPEELFVPWRT